MTGEKSLQPLQAGKTSGSERREILEEGPITLWRVLSIALGRKRLLVVAGLGGAVLAASIALMLPNTYTATAVILPPQKQQSAASLLAGQLGPLASATGSDLLKSPSDLYISLLSSRTIADRLIERFGLASLYRTNTATDTRTALRNRSRFNSVRNSVIRIDVDDHDPRRAAAIANAYITELDAQNRKLAVTEAGQRRAFLENQIADEKNALSNAEDAMKRTQQQTGVLDVGGQTQVAIASLAQLRAQITAGEVALQRLTMGATPENPEVLQAEAQLAELRAQFRKLDKSSSHGDPLVSTSAMPQVGLDYVRALRDLKYHEFLFELLSKQYEAARIDESKASPALQVVDPAIPPDKKSGPPRAVITVMGCFAGLICATLVAFLQWYRMATRLRFDAT